MAAAKPLDKARMSCCGAVVAPKHTVLALGARVAEKRSLRVTLQDETLSP